MWKFLLKNLREVVLLIVVVGIIMGSSLGLRLPYKFPIVSVGAYQLSAFESGLSLYQLNRQSSFYNISPLNDFHIDPQGNRLVHLEPIDFEEKNYTTQFDQATWLRVTDAFLAYYNQLDPYYAIKSSNFHANYRTTVEGTSITIEKTLELQTDEMIQQGMTYGFAENDVVFDPDSNTVVYRNSDLEALIINEVFDRPFGVILSPDQAEELEYDKLTVSNPEIAGYVTIEAMENQRLTIDPEFRLIELVEPLPEATSSGVMRMQLQVEDYEF